MILSQKEDIIPIYDRTNREKRTLKTCADVKQSKYINSKCNNLARNLINKEQTYHSENFQHPRRKSRPLFSSPLYTLKLQAQVNHSSGIKRDRPPTFSENPTIVLTSSKERFTKSPPWCTWCMTSRKLDPVSLLRTSQNGGKVRTAGRSASQSFFTTANFSVAQVSFAQKIFILFDFNSMGLASGTSSFSL